MCNCNNSDSNKLAENADVPNFQLTGLEPVLQTETALQGSLPEDVLAFEFKGCVKATIEHGKVCFDLPYFGKQCISLPVPVPSVPGDLTACFESCGKFVPTGAKITVYFSGVKLFTYTLGFC